MELTLNNETLRFLPGTEKHLCYLQASVVPTDQTALVVHQATIDVKEKETGTTTDTNKKDNDETVPNLWHQDEMKFEICFEKDVSKDKVESTRSWADVVMNTDLKKMQELNVVSDDEDSVADPSGKPTSKPYEINQVPISSSKQMTITETENITIDKPHETATKANKSAILDPTPVQTVKKGHRRVVGTKTTCALVPKDYNEAHNQWGHHGDRRLKEMARVMGYKLTGTPLPCDAFGIAKATRARVLKTTSVQATKPGERLFVDTTGPFPEVPIKFKYLFGAVDDYSGKLSMMFGSNINVLVQFIQEAYERFKGDGRRRRKCGCQKNLS